MYLGYVDGVALPTVRNAAPVYGRISSERVQGLQVLHLWPHNFPMNARTAASKPIASLWRPEISVFLEIEFGVRGLERTPQGRWVAQRWLIEPMTSAEVDRALGGVRMRT